MKKLVTIAILVAAVPVMAGIYATNLFTLQTVTNAAVTSISYAPNGELRLNQQSFIIQHAAMTNVTCLSGKYQVSFDSGSNWTTVATFAPTSTNATTETWQPTLTSTAPLTRFVLTVTDTNTVGANSAWVQ